MRNVWCLVILAKVMSMGSGREGRGLLPEWSFDLHAAS
jgi:hypothetical protein